MNPSERLYNCAIHLGLPVAIAVSYRAYWNRQADRHLSERFLINPPPPDLPKARIWLHGASVGEMKLIRILRDWALESVEPEQILVTAGTRSGLDTLDHPRKNLLPMDYPALLRPFLKQAGAAPLVVVETEIWPNLYRLAPGPIHIYNGHLKPESFSLYTRFKPVISSALSRVTNILARSPREARRFRVLAGDRQAPVSTAGNMKWIPLAEAAEPPDLAGPTFGPRETVFVAGSTWPGEEQPVLRETRRAGLKTYLAPRHLDRLPEVEEMLKRSGLDWTRWSEADGRVDCDIVLVDTMGVLSDLYARADFCFVGGSWVEDVGGHDLLEPARYGVPILVGPHVSNVSEEAGLLESAGELVRLDSEVDWKQAINRMGERETENTSGPVPAIRTRASDIKQVYYQNFCRLMGESS